MASNILSIFGARMLYGKASTIPVLLHSVWLRLASRLIRIDSAFQYIQSQQEPG
jgi:hypothetical protein